MTKIIGGHLNVVPTTNVVDLSVVTTLDIPVERILRKAMEADLESIIILGMRKNGEEYFCSSVADGGTVLWKLERCKRQLLATDDWSA